MKLYEYDIVVTTEDFSEQHVALGRRGTIVIVFKDDDKNVVVEFGDLDGGSYALASLPVSCLVSLGRRPDAPVRGSSK